MSGPLSWCKPGLRPRELEMLAAGAAGETNKETARRLFLSEDTIKSHWKHVFWKLGARNRAHAVAIAYQQGLLPLGPAA